MSIIVRGRQRQSRHRFKQEMKRQNQIFYCPKEIIELAQGNIILSQYEQGHEGGGWKRELGKVKTGKRERKLSYFKYQYCSYMEQKQVFPSRTRTTSIKLSKPIVGPIPPPRPPCLELQELSQITFPLGSLVSPSDPCFNLITPRRVRQREAPHSASKKKMKLKCQNISEESKQTRWKHQKRHSDKMKSIVHLSELLKVFFQKISINNTSRPPIQFDPVNQQQQGDGQQLLCQVKLQLPHGIEHLLTGLKMLFILTFSFAFPLSLLYSEVAQSLPVLLLKAMALLLCLFDLFDTFQPHPDPYLLSQEGRLTSKQQKLTLISQLIITAMVLASMVITEYNVTLSSYFFGAMLANLKRYQKGAIRLQSRFLTATHYEKYWDLVKVLAINLLVCHLLACMLIAVTQFQQESNWMREKGIDGAPWYQQYIWSYYFGTTIILTIGFGDLHASNYIEAFFIITISLFACLFFGYNLNYIGHLISSIHIDEEEKLQKLKIFGNLSRNTNITHELKEQITNFIIQEAQIKKVSNYSYEKKLLGELPQTLKSHFLQQANKRLFNNLLQMVKLTKKTVENLAENIQTRICHPGEVIKRANSKLSLIILQSGEVGFVSRLNGSTKLNNVLLERIHCGVKDQSKLVCIDVLENQRINYDIKSLSYSVIYYMEEEVWEKTLAMNTEDHQLFRQLRDKCRYKIVEFGVTVCRFCNKKHTLFDCPRLHFLPLRRTLPNQYLSNKPLERQPRVSVVRNKKTCNFAVAEQSNNHSPLEDLGFEQLFKVSEHVQIKGKERSNSSMKPQKRSSYLRTKEVVTQIREELKKMQKQQKIDCNFQFTLWSNVDCDQAHNFTYYFPRGNSDKLGQKQVRKEILTLTKTIKRKVKKDAVNLLSTL